MLDLLTLLFLVSQDANVEKLLETNHVDVVISSSGLKRLMDNTDYNKFWEIPVVIKQQSLKKGFLIVFCQLLSYI